MPWSRWIRRRASCCGCTPSTKERAARLLRGSFPAAALPTGPTAKKERILYVTQGYRLIALDARTGIPVPTFGKDGVVDLRLNDDQEMDLVNADIGLHATPIVAGNTIIVGAAHRSGARAEEQSQRERLCPRLRCEDRRSASGYSTPYRGSQENSVTTPGRRALRSTQETPASGPRSASMKTWAWPICRLNYRRAIPMVVSARETAYLRESMVAVDLKTGQRKWHYQLVHHGLWDFDIPCAPVLVDITVNGKPVKASRKQPSNPFSTC